MSTFDAPNRDTCIVRRARTNTPLQALVTMNDPVYIEAAQALAKKALSENETIEAAVSTIFRRCLVRTPTEREVKRLVKLYSGAQAQYAQDVQKAIQMAGSHQPNTDPVNIAAMTVVANVILNLDEMVMKP